MKQSLQFLAGITHPVFLPIYAFLLYNPLINKYGNTVFALFGTWYLFLYLILPVLYFIKIKKMDLISPTNLEREAIYKTYLAINIILGTICFLMMPEFSKFFLGLLVLYVILYVLAAIKLKASWHVSAWAYLLVAGLIVKFTNNLNGQFEVIGGLLILLVIVSAVRWKQNAHTLFEIGMALAAGAASSTLLLFI